MLWQLPGKSGSMWRINVDNVDNLVYNCFFPYLWDERVGIKMGEKYTRGCG
jgi:hypothetical protein